MYWLVGIAGLVLAAAPFVLGYSANQNAMWTSVVTGLVALAAALWTAIAKDQARWEYWVAGLAGLLAIAGPWLFWFSAESTPTWTNVVMGALLVVFSGYELLRQNPAAQRPRTG